MTDTHTDPTEADMEIAQRVLVAWDHDSAGLPVLIAKAIAQARKEEREACALECDEQEEVFMANQPYSSSGERRGCRGCAELIRARGEKS